MKRSVSTLLLAAILLTACGSASQEVVVNTSETFIREYGDDIVRLASESGDDMARQTTKYSPEVINYWDDILRQTPRTVEKVPSTLIYRTTSHLYPEQIYLLERLQNELSLSADEAALYLQGTCSIASWAALFGDYPSKDFTQVYVESMAEKNGIKIVSIIEFVQSIIDFSTAIIDDPNFNSRQEGAKIIFDTLCMVAG